MCKNNKFRKLTLLSLVFCLLLFTNFTYAWSKEPRVIKPRRVYPIIDLSSTLQDRVSVMRFQPTDASRLYGYSLWAASAGYLISNGDGEVGASAGAYVASKIVSAKPLTNEMDAFLTRSGVSKSSAKYTEGIAIGKKVLSYAEKDGYAEKSIANKLIGVDRLPKDYQYTPTGSGDGALDPRFGDITPIITEVGECRINVPSPDVIKSEGVRMYKNFKPANAVGIDVLWWLAGVGTSAPSGYWLRITNTAIKDYSISELDANKLIGEVALAEYQAGVMVWKYKFQVNELRPESLWKKLYKAPQDILPRDTPNHPSFPSGHSGFSAAAATVLEKYIGGKPIRDKLPPDLYASSWERVWKNPREAVREASNSRVRAGFHYPVDVREGERLGNCIGESIYSNYKTLNSDLMNVKGSESTKSGSRR